jgi:ABC-2 type transport system ATP-binding protein
MATPIPVTLDGQPHSISRDLEIVAERAPAGGGYQLQLTASSSLYDIQRSTGAVTFNGIDVTMPLGDPVAAASGVAAKHRRKHHKRKHHR